MQPESDEDWPADRSFDRRDLIRMVHGRKRQTRVDPAAIDMHRASAALTVIAALLRSGQVQGLSQTVKQSRAWVNLHPMFLSIHPQRDRNYSSHLHWCLCLLLLDLGLCETEQGTRGCSSASSSKPRQE